MTSTCCKSYHLHIPWMHQIGFVTQNVPNFYMFVCRCGHQTTFNLAAQVQTYKKNWLTVWSVCLKRKQGFHHTVQRKQEQIICAWENAGFGGGLFFCFDYRDTRFTYQTPLHHELSVWKQVYLSVHPDSRQIHPLCWPETTTMKH